MIKKVLLGFGVVGLALAATTIGASADSLETQNEIDQYYSEIDSTQTGEALATSLHSLSETKHTTKIGYRDLWGLYGTSDVLPGTKVIWDVYSDCIFTLATDQAGTYSKEGDAYNREHMIPQSWFNEKTPMVADAHHIFATDGYVNNRRSNYPHGEVSSPTYTSKNGGKLGQSTSTLYTGTVFEPIDEYKGDIARAYMYMAIRYSNELSDWTWVADAHKIFKGSYPFLTEYSIDMFTKWSHQDPVSDKEYLRNNAIADRQGVRNPFVDHPEYIDKIWTNNYQDEASNTVYSAPDVVNAIAALTETSESKTVYTVYNQYCRLNTLEKADVSNADTLFAKVEAISGTGIDLSDLWDDVRSRPDFPAIGVTVDQDKVDAVIAQIEQLPTTITLDHEAIVEAANLAYKALNRAEKKAVTNSAKLTEAVTAIDTLNSTQYHLVTDFFQLKEGDKVIILAKSAAKAMGDVTGNYRSGVDATNNNNVVSLKKSSIATVFTLADGTGEGTFAFQEGNNFLSASSDYANLVNSTTINDLSSWDIEFDSDGLATVVAQGSNKYTMVWNNTHSDFSTKLNPTNNEKVMIFKFDDGVDPANPSATLKFVKLHTQSSLKFIYDTTTSSLTADEVEKATLVTDVSVLTEGSRIVITSKANNKAMANTQGSSANNRGSVAATFNADDTVDVNENVQVIVLEAGTQAGSFALNIGDKYLEAPGTGNHLKEANGITDKGSFTFTITNDVMTIQSVGTTDKGTLKFNKGSNIFSCYGSGQENVEVYKLPGAAVTTTYTYSSVSITFALGMTKELYNELKALDTNVTFGMEISVDGGAASEVVAYVLPVESLYSEAVNTSGNFYQFIERKLITSAGYATKYSVRAFVKVGNVAHYAKSTEYSVKTLLEYYIANATALGISNDTLKVLRAFNKQAN